MDKEKTVDPQSPPPPWSDHECSSDIEYLMDSDGEKYEVYSDGTHDMTSKEWDECCRRVEEESEDYDVQVFPIVANFGIIQPMALDEKQLPKFIRAAAVTLDKYKKDKEVSGTLYYLTFEVVDPDDENRVKVFQAKVLELFGDDEYEVDQIRPKPTYPLIIHMVITLKSSYLFLISPYLYFYLRRDRVDDHIAIQ
ncbi:hypothetical protein CDL15_Pgr018274 [Punica granatum]|uniref:Cystatin domain-containing protein n=1 Tax=Punica granatum TaxID=22663 RepID=A0A218WIT8_PUNGR|nr:hypothetical protein CDL15_Pgr018274 [Punica granatum]